MTGSMTGPFPVPDPDSASFWAATAQRRLSLPRCGHCHRLYYPPPPRCPDCLRPLTEWRTLSGRGSLHSWTEVHAALVPGLPTPYLVAEVELAEQPGLLLVSNLVDTEAPGLGEPVELTWSPPFPDGSRLPRFRRTRDPATATP
jgi:hypothetical protein